MSFTGRKIRRSSGRAGFCHQVTARLMPGEPRNGFPPRGSKLQSFRPVAASSACTWSVAVETYMRPSTTMGVHSMVVEGRWRASPVRWVQATFSSATLSRLIWSSGE